MPEDFTDRPQRGKDRRIQEPGESSPPDDYDEPRSQRFGEPPYPKTVKVAGVIWIIFGCLILLGSLVNLAVTFSMAPPGGQGGGAYAAGGMCGIVVNALFGAAFLFVGVQSIQGTAKDTLGNAIGSIVLSLLVGGFGALAVIGALALMTLGAPFALLLVVIAGVYALSGIGLLTAGVMALMGRGQYLEWKKAELRKLGDRD